MMSQRRDSIGVGRRIAALLLALSTGPGSPAMADPPRLYSQPGFQGPVGGAADDLLVLPGWGFSKDDVIVFRAVGDGASAGTPAASVPSGAGPDSGTAEVVSLANLPYSLTIRLPGVIRRQQTYEIRARNGTGEWSNAIRINDPRPFWSTPAYVYATAALQGLPRELKIVGRNLAPVTGNAARIRLTGPQNLALTATATGTDDGTTDYVVAAALPAQLKAGDYRLAISRNGSDWLDVPTHLLVRADPPTVPGYRIDDPAFGNCRPDDGVDDTPCLRKAIEAAHAAGHGAVVLGPGAWDLEGSAAPALDAVNGLILPANVDLIGAGTDKTRLIRHRSWNRSPAQATLTLTGDSRVSGIRFHDQETYSSTDPLTPTLQLGLKTFRIDGNVAAERPVETRDVIITDNVFDRVSVAVADGGLPIRHLFITRNTFGAYRSDLELGGNPYNLGFAFRVEDSTVAYNVFKPGSYLDASIGQGVMASETGGSRRLDFSHNFADGASTDFLYAPDDARGWRAAFFFHMNASHEQLLVADNVATCTGDKAGDGEAIAFDNNGNTFGLETAATVDAARPDGVTVKAQLRGHQDHGDVDVSRYYIGHWIQVVEGPGLGQARPIVSYHIDAATREIAFTVSPGWDVAPVPGASRISVGREFWQAYITGNRIDHRQPLCRKSNRTARKGGVIALWAQSTDSVIAGNQQYDTDGILYQQSYGALGRNSAVVPGTFIQGFLDISENRIEGEYDWDSDCSSSGIHGMVSAAARSDWAPPIVSYGTSIAHNTILHADGWWGGALSMPLTWAAGPSPNRWNLVDNTVIHHNLLKDVSGPRPRPTCGGRSGAARTGINLSGSDLVWNTVLYANRCENVSSGYRPGGVETVRLCPSPAADGSSCECSTH